MTPGFAKQSAGFLIGASLILGPGLAMIRHARHAPQPAARHDYFPPPQLANDRRFRIVAFGSSSTHGYGASSPAATYPARLQALLDIAKLAPTGVDVVNRGIDGESIEGMLKRIDDDILPRRPNLVVWQLGSNDALRGIPPDAFGRSLRAGIVALRATGVPLVLIGPQWNPDPNHAAAFARMNDIMLAASRDMGVPMIDRVAEMQRWICLGLLKPAAMVGADGLHMTDEGYALLARAVFDLIATKVPSLRAGRAVEPAG